MNERLSDDIAALMTAVGIVTTDSVVRVGHRLNRLAMRAFPPYAAHHDRKIYRMMVIEPPMDKFAPDMPEPRVICHNRMRLSRQR